MMKKMSKAYITLKIEERLLDQVKSIAKNKFPLRNITSYAEATREALIEFVNKNRKYVKKPTNRPKIENIMEEI